MQIATVTFWSVTIVAQPSPLRIRTRRTFFVCLRLLVMLVCLEEQTLNQIFILITLQVNDLSCVLCKMLLLTQY